MYGWSCQSRFEEHVNYVRAGLKSNWAVDGINMTREANTDAGTDAVARAPEAQPEPAAAG